MRTLLTFLLILSQLCALAQQFGPKQNVSKGIADPSVNLSVDINSDGWLDVLVASRWDGKAGWYPNLGVDGFGELRLISPFIDEIKYVAPGDIDNDGDLDIVADSYGELLLFTNDGTGVFSNPEPLVAFNFYALDIHFADLDGDNLLDLMYFQWPSGLHVMYNQGSGQFGEPQLISDASQNLTQVETLDIDGDLDTDIIYVSGSAIYTIENLGNGEFGDLISLGNGSDFHALCIDDLDEDEDLDIAVLANGVKWYENDGNGAYTQHDVFSSEYWATDMEIADIDSDGDLDLVCNLGTGLVYYRNDGGASSFTRLTETLDVIEPKSILIEDFNQNGSLDVILVSPDQSIMTLYAGTETPLSFEDGQNIGAPLTPFAHLSVADLNGDGMPDLLASGQDKLIGYTQEDFWNFSGPNVISPLDVHYRQTYPYDFNLDGFMDFAVVASGLNEVKLFINGGDGNFLLQTTISFDVSAPLAVTGADLDNDGDIDLITASDNGEKLAWYPNQGGLVFGDQVVISNDLTALSEIFPLDINNDGNTDIIFRTGNSTIVWMENIGDGVFGPIIEISQFLQELAVIDFDSDGDLDVLQTRVIGSYLEIFSSEIILLENDGNENFSLHVIASSEDLIFRRLEPQDYNNDGLMDIAVVCGYNSYATPESEGLFYLQGLGNYAMLSPEFISSLTRETLYITSSDIDGDGDLDLATAALRSRSIDVYENLSLVNSITETSTPPITLFPNPMRNSSIVNLSSFQDEVLLEVYDVAGKLLRSERVQSDNLGSSDNWYRLERGSLARGSYLLRVSSGDTHQDLPFIIE